MSKCQHTPTPLKEEYPYIVLYGRYKGLFDAQIDGLCQTAKSIRAPQNTIYINKFGSPITIDECPDPNVNEFIKNAGLEVSKKYGDGLSSEIWGIVDRYLLNQQESIRTTLFHDILKLVISQKSKP